MLTNIFLDCTFAHLFLCVALLCNMVGAILEVCIPNLIVNSVFLFQLVKLETVKIVLLLSYIATPYGQLRKILFTQDTLALLVVCSGYCPTIGYYHYLLFCFYFGFRASSPDGTDTVLYICGLSWFFFAETIQLVSTSITSNAFLVKRVRFPLKHSLSPPFYLE